MNLNKYIQHVLLNLLKAVLQIQEINVRQNSYTTSLCCLKYQFFSPQTEAVDEACDLIYPRQ